MKIKAKLVNNEVLTAREGEVLELICSAKNDKTIARMLGISAKMVEAHSSRIYEKLNVRNAETNARCAAISASVARGIVRISI
ncbi:LuxR C-terminal-related transcriptional regulator [Methylobacter sp. Wu1]|uniref:response regulator transcription factor n=1 Tax=Methylobacter sp. Wu1 TaxID=3119359 RepID=UPI002F92F47A